MSIRGWVSRNTEVLVLFGIAAALVVIWLVCHAERARAANGRQCTRIRADSAGNGIVTCTSEIP